MWGRKVKKSESQSDADDERPIGNQPPCPTKERCWAICPFALFIFFFLPNTTTTTTQPADIWETDMCIIEAGQFGVRHNGRFSYAYGLKIVPVRAYILPLLAPALLAFALRICSGYPWSVMCALSFLSWFCLTLCLRYSEASPLPPLLLSHPARGKRREDGEQCVESDRSHLYDVWSHVLRRIPPGSSARVVAPSSAGTGESWLHLPRPRTHTGAARSRRRKGTSG